MSGADKPSHTRLKVTQIGNSLGMVLPKPNPDFERRMKLAREIMTKRHNLLRELAK